MRGTRSLGFTLDGTASPDQILPAPFADIASQTMLPVSHVLWTSLWLGLASDAVGRARGIRPRRGAAHPGRRTAGARRLAELVAELNTMAATVQAGREDFARHQSDPEALAGLGFAIRMNNLKVAAARMAPEIVAGALGVCGISGYRNDSPLRSRAASARCSRRVAHGQQRSDPRRQCCDAPAPQGGLTWRLWP